jgi:hypothetical protein
LKIRRGCGRNRQEKNIVGITFIWHFKNLTAYPSLQTCVSGYKIVVEKMNKTPLKKSIFISPLVVT